MSSVSSKDFSARELAEIKEAFTMFDIDGGGTFSYYWWLFLRARGIIRGVCMEDGIDCDALVTRLFLLYITS